MITFTLHNKYVVPQSQSFIDRVYSACSLLMMIIAFNNCIYYIRVSFSLNFLECECVSCYTREVLVDAPIARAGAWVHTCKDTSRFFRLPLVRTRLLIYKTKNRPTMVASSYIDTYICIYYSYKIIHTNRQSILHSIYKLKIQLCAPSHSYKEIMLHVHSVFHSIL